MYTGDFENPTVSSKQGENSSWAGVQADYEAAIEGYDPDDDSNTVCAFEFGEELILSEKPIVDEQANYEAAIEGYDPNFPDSPDFPTVVESGEKITRIYTPGEDGRYRYLSSLNGGQIKTDEGVQLECQIFYEELPDGSRREKGANFSMNGYSYLTDIFDNTPYGIIKKNKTGVGATTLEIKSPRHSIIVVPTKTLAYSKAKTGIEEITGQINYLYVGSKMDEGDSIQWPTISEYLGNENIKYKKFIVVADSLYKVIQAIPNVYNTFFLMIDEVDIFQSDSTFREALEGVIDYYFKFKRKNRCLVSATIKDFSNPLINDEPFLNITYPDSSSRNIVLIHTDNINAIVAEGIKKLYESTGDKIVIAYNKILCIRQIIECLENNLKQECSILCSISSIQQAGTEYYASLHNGQLPKRINFMTCTYFAGIDISERFHLISVSNVEFVYTLLSPAQYTQIAGRCRHPEGLLSETIIYNSKPYKGKIQHPKSIKKYLLEFGNDIKEYVNKANVLIGKYYKENEPEKSLLDKSFKTIQEDIKNKSKRSYFRGAKTSIIRKNVITGEYDIAYFNIDAIYETLQLKIGLYSEPHTLCRELTNMNDVPVLFMNKEVTPLQQANNQKIEALFKSLEEQSFDKLINIITQLHEKDELTEEKFKSLRRGEFRKQQNFIDNFKRLYEYVPFEKLIVDLIELGNDKRKQRSYNNSAIFWALAEDHVFKIDMMHKFNEGYIYTQEEIKEKIHSVYRQHFNKTITSRSHTKILGEYFHIERIDPRKNTYAVVSHNKYHFPDFPLKELPPDISLKDAGLIQFSSN